MNIKKPKIKPDHNLRIPKRKKVRVNPLGINKKRMSKNHGSIKTPKQTKAKNKKPHRKNNSNIKDRIKDEKIIFQKNSEKLKKDIKKLQTLVISISGLEQLNEQSIKKIQKERLKICKESERLFEKINHSAKRLTELESGFINSR